ncbi:hypothetical protein NM688_g7678 [Phlebia brevispora]|uniref:Uncharacterized protein n=1 Tax=Phlebia brevispora TaxID=194682 RepID=A0ACC1S2B6_9APHY|nr:hypothetical protein NM688_g7678 [Phlebia brevispora]
MLTSYRGEGGAVFSGAETLFARSYLCTGDHITISYRAVFSFKADIVPREASKGRVVKWYKSVVCVVRRWTYCAPRVSKLASLETGERRFVKKLASFTSARDIDARKLASISSAYFPRLRSLARAYKLASLRPRSTRQAGKQLADTARALAAYLLTAATTGLLREVTQKLLEDTHVTMKLDCTLSSVPLMAPGDDTGPYALANFLPAGTLVLLTSSSTTSCNHSHLTGWHDWPGYLHLSSMVRAEDQDLLHILDFLTLHKFVAATCLIGTPSKLFIRVYIIPHDLGNVEGRLRRRDMLTIVQPARRYMRILLSGLTRDRSSWEAATSDESFLPFFSNEADDRTLAEVYNTLPSPSTRDEPGDSLITKVLGKTSRFSRMRTTLYSYQRRSVAAMVERELHPGTVPDPLFVPIHRVEGAAGQETFFLQPATMEILRERPSVAQIRGGILCEELGTGKTVMTLALIACTLDQLPAPEESILDARPVLTPLAFRYFPSDDFVAARVKLSSGTRRRKLGNPAEHGPRIPSLVEHLVHFCRANPRGLHLQRYESELEARALWDPLQKNVPFYYHYDEPVEDRRPSRKQAPPGPRRMYLTNATLVLVPPNLYNQWVNEINKHCNSRITSRVYRATNEPLPGARELCSAYDIVLMTHPRFSAEFHKTSIQWLHSWRICTCPEVPGAVRVPDCKCSARVKDVSPLLQIRWKRLVVDEGHVAGTTSTNLMALIKMLSIERKWIVTGTPTTNLMGLHFGQGSELMYPEEPEDLEYGEYVAQGNDEQRDYPMDIETSGTSSATSDSRAEPSSLSFHPEAEANPVSPDTSLESIFSGLPQGARERSLSPRSIRVWTKDDREDLHKMGNMVSSFLELPAFAADSKLFSSHVVAPLMDAAGPRPGSVQVLTQVMESVMVRHRIEDVEKEILLPLMSQETVLLDLDPYALKTYNAMQAMIAINAIDSERIDQDYFFHARNSAHLQQLNENISQAMFWHVDEQHLNVDEVLGISGKLIKRAEENVEKGTISAEDLNLLHKALEYVKSAAADQVWRSLMLHIYVFQRVYDMPEDVYEAWSVHAPGISCTSDLQHTEPYHLLIPDRLRTLRNLLARHPFAQIPRMIEWGQAVSEEDQARINFAKQRAYSSKAGKKNKDREPRKDASAVAAVDHVAQFMAAQDKLKALMASDQEGDVQGNAMLLASSPLRGVRIGSSTSSKLNYILREVQMYQTEAKFLVFSRSPLTLRYVAEGLSLMGVQYKLTSQQPIRAVEQDVTTFESSETFRVFLMELKHGARGLNLVTASRVIFCEPVWQADVESQAIKVGRVRA